MKHQDTLSSIANLASTYAYQGNSSSGAQGRIRSLTDRIRDNIQIVEEDMVQVTTFFGKELIVLLLDLKRDNVLVIEVVVKAAARNQGYGKEVMVLLFDRCGDKVKITEEVVKVAAGNLREEIMALLLERRGDEVKITEEVVKAAARNE